MSGFVYDSAVQRRVLRVIPDLIRARELLFDLVWKDLRARYRYAVMGFAWALLEPLAMMLVLTFVFTFVFRAKVQAVQEASQVNFAAMLLCGLIFWQYTATALMTATLSLVDNQNLVKKVRFVRETVPLAAVCFPIVNLCVGFVLLLAVHLLLGGSLGLALVGVPVLFGIQFMLTAGLALLFSCGHVLFRDVGNMVNVAVMFGFYASPVFYPLEFVTSMKNLPPWIEGVYPWLARLYMLNPMAGLLTAYRDLILYHRLPDPALLAWPVLAACLAMALGVWVFRRNAPTFSDHL